MMQTNTSAVSSRTINHESQLEMGLIQIFFLLIVDWNSSSTIQMHIPPFQGENGGSEIIDYPTMISLPRSLTSTEMVHLPLMKCVLGLNSVNSVPKSQQVVTLRENYHAA